MQLSHVSRLNLPASTPSPHDTATIGEVAKPSDGFYGWARGQTRQVSLSLYLSVLFLCLVCPLGKLSLLPAASLSHPHPLPPPPFLHTVFSSLFF